MTTEQEAHLYRIKTEFNKQCDAKYRKGQAEHGGDLFRKSLIGLLDSAIDEAIDQVVYLLTLKEKMASLGKEKEREE